MSDQWEECFQEYERLTGVEPLNLDEVKAGTMSPAEAWRANIGWIESVYQECINIKTPDQ